MSKKTINNDYPLITMGDITDEARKIAVKWGDEYFPGFALPEKHKLASDIMNYARRFSSSVDMLITYSEWLTKKGYMDTDWKDEKPYAIDEFLKNLRK